MRGDDGEGWRGGTVTVSGRNGLNPPSSSPNPLYPCSLPSPYTTGIALAIWTPGASATRRQKQRPWASWQFCGRGPEKVWGEGLNWKAIVRAVGHVLWEGHDGTLGREQGQLWLPAMPIHASASLLLIRPWHAVENAPDMRKRNGIPIAADLCSILGFLPPSFHLEDPGMGFRR